MPPSIFRPLPDISDGDYWADIRDGQTRTDSPLRVGYTCEVIQEWRDRSSQWTYQKGMAGKVLAFNNVSVSVGFQGLNDKRTVPRNILKGGPVKWGTWKAQGHDIDFKIAPRKSKDVNMDKQFPISVHTFLSALQDSNFATIGGYLSVVGQNGENIDSITRRIVLGVEEAGLLDVLNNPKFTVHDIRQSASLTIGGGAESKRSGVYLRIYTTIDGHIHDIQIYVGKSKNFAARYTGVSGPRGKSNEPKHWSLHNRDDVTAVWVALCFLDDMPDSILHVAEQVFTSLLETYRRDVIAPSKADTEKPWLEGMIASASYMYAAAQEIKATWPGAAFSRPAQFGAAKGMNLQSPLFEINKDRTLFIRVDSYHSITSTKEVVRIANFRRAVPRKANWNRLQKSKDQQIIAWMNFNWGESSKVIKWAPASTEKDDVVAKGIEVPSRDTLYATVFEVRLDGKPHPMSYMRGPQIPVFVNSPIADSWALRIEWIDATGTLRSRFVQPAGTHFNYNVPKAARGQSEHYLRCMALIHHLFDVPYTQNRSKFFDMGAANVLQAHHDYFLQEISFRPQTPYPNTIDYSRISDTRQIEMMVDAGLKNVNIQWKDRPKGRRGQLRCDSCLLEGESGVKSHMSCEPKDGVSTNVCIHCYDDFGRSACSFTPNNRIRNQEDAAYKAKYRPLLHMPEQVSDAMDTVDPQLQLIQSIEQEEVSDDELDI
ncbi:hypothetical protein BKA63DRAFT_602620 [Paraphoma chrysanthemicola]|nr:hypothetical protein BKA63DRAFT_602620 [Paraphoma chrysanthemicola]